MILDNLVFPSLALTSLVSDELLPMCTHRDGSPTGRARSVVGLSWSVQCARMSIVPRSAFRFCSECAACPQLCPPHPARQLIAKTNLLRCIDVMQLLVHFVLPSQAFSACGVQTYKLCIRIRTVGTFECLLRPRRRVSTSS